MSQSNKLLHRSINNSNGRGESSPEAERNVHNSSKHAHEDYANCDDCQDC